MKIAYAAHLNFPPGSGIMRKVISQTRYWGESGHNVELHVLTRVPDVAEFIKQVGGFVYFYRGGPFARSRLRAVNQLAESVLNTGADLVYFRRDMFYPAHKRLAEGKPLVVEVNTDELAELRLYKKTHYLYHAATRRCLDMRAAGFVFVTRELMTSTYYARLPALKTVIANGIDLDGLPQLPPTSNTHPVLVFLGYSEPWHGIDKILRLAEAFPDWTFHLIGVGDTLPRPPNVFAYAHSEFKEYIRILKHADVAIGPLALHRKKLAEASPLKVREYLALGLPVIVAYADPDFPGDVDFLLKLPNTEGNVEHGLMEIRRFVERWCGRRVDRNQVKHLDVRIKEKQRIMFFQQVLDRMRLTSPGAFHALPTEVK